MAQPFPRGDVFSVKEIAKAAGVRPKIVRAWANAGHIDICRGFVRQSDAIALVNSLQAEAPKQAERPRSR